MIKNVDHIAIVVKDLDASLEKYKKIFGISEKQIIRETVPSASVRIGFVPVGEVLLEFMQPLSSGKGNAGKFLEENGEGLYHIAFNVDKIDAELAKLRASGIKLRDESPRPGSRGARIAFISPNETNNARMELLEKGEI